MADAFISYHEKSAGELAQKIADALDAAGISCWCARRDMPPGDDFARLIPQQIRDCRLFLWILNNGAYHSRNVEHEVGLAFRRLNQGENITIFPIVTADFEWKEGEWIDYYLIHIQCVKLPETDDAHIRELVWRIAGVLHMEPHFSATVIQSGSCGDNVAYTLEDSGLLTISGVGPMRDYLWNREKQHADTPWSEKRKTISAVRIQDGVTSIGKRTFAECENLVDIRIPDSVTSIGDYAFWSCDKLTNVEIPNRVTSIGDSTFAYCRRLKSVKIPDGVTSIGERAFSDCYGLRSIEIPDGVTSIGDCAFYDCHGFRSVYIPDNVTSIGEFAFFTKCLESASVPANVKIAPHAFPHYATVTRRP